MLGLDAWIFTRCADCDKPKILSVESGRLRETAGCIHFAVPAKQWWEDVGFTWSTILYFRSEEHVARWCEKTGHPRGEIIPLPRCWELAKAWYTDRLDPKWRRKRPEEVKTIFENIGLTGKFWRLE